MVGAARYLDPAVIARLGTIDLKARTIVEGFLTGLHRSPNKGFSVEFAEYRQYLPGDDLATLDWKVYARSDKHFVKKYEEETNLACHLLVDVSRSMGYASGGVTKLQYASFLIGAIAYLMHRQRDSFGLISFDERIRAMLPASARSGHLRTVLLALERLEMGGTTNVAKPLNDLALAVRKRGMIVLVSDLFDDPQRVLDGLKHFRYRGTDVIVFHILDPYELKFPFDQAARFRDPETEEEVLAVPGMVRDDYITKMHERIAFYRRELALVGIDYCLLDTSQPLELGLMAYLMTRHRAI